MSEVTAVLKEFKPKDGNKPYRVVDGNDTEYATYKDEIATGARELVGQRVLIRFTEKTNEKDGRTFTNRYLDGVEAVKENGDHPPLGTGEYVTGQKPPIEVRRIAAATAWNNGSRLAEIYFSHLTGREVTPELVKDIAERFSHDIFLDLLRKGKALEDDDIPFG